MLSILFCIIIFGMKVLSYHLSLDFSPFLPINILHFQHSTDSPYQKIFCHTRISMQNTIFFWWMFYIYFSYFFFTYFLPISVLHIFNLLSQQWFLFLIFHYKSITEAPYDILLQQMFLNSLAISVFRQIAPTS